MGCVNQKRINNLFEYLTILINYPEQRDRHDKVCNEIEKRLELNG